MGVLVLGGNKEGREEEERKERKGWLDLLALSDLECLELYFAE